MGKAGSFAILGLSQMKWEQTLRFTDSPRVQLAARGQEVTVGVNPETYSKSDQGQYRSLLKDPEQLGKCRLLRDWPIPH